MKASGLVAAGIHPPKARFSSYVDVLSPAKGSTQSGADKAPLIRMTQLSKSYAMGSVIVHALDDIDFAVSRGEFVAIIGPSGSGKSTLMNIIGLLDVPASGLYELEGYNVARLSDSEASDLRNRTIGFVFQSFNLLSTLTALENVKLPLLYRGTKPREADSLARLYLNKVGLAGRERHLPHQLSGGQQQRVAIARALVGSPEIILADEPTGALDSHTSIEIMELFASLHREGQTVIFITHNPQLTAQAQRVVHIADGKLSEKLSTPAASSATTTAPLAANPFTSTTNTPTKQPAERGAHASRANLQNCTL